MSLKTNEDFEDQRNKQVSRMRASLDYAMGCLIILIGLFLIFRFKLDIKLNKSYPPDIFDTLYGILAIIYGGWRIYRGYKKNYFK